MRSNVIERVHLPFFKLFNSERSRMANRCFPFPRLHTYPVTFWAPPFAVPMIDMTFQFAHGDAASFARHFKPLVFLARIDTINYLRISYRPLFRFTRSIWRADASCAPKIAQQRSVATRIRETYFCRSTVKLQPLARPPGIEPGIADYECSSSGIRHRPANAGDKRSESLLCLPSLTTKERGSNPPSHHVLPPAFTG